MNYMEKCKLWLESPYIDDMSRWEIEGLKNDDAQLQLRFEKDIEFGTAGLRGICGAGSKCMNYTTVGWITQGISNLINDQHAADRGVVIGRDSRLMSKEFAIYSARVFAANGIKVYLFDDIRPTAQVSFAVLYLNAVAGINITASHNPKQYNGYKTYWSDGAQISPALAQKVVEAAGDNMLVPVNICDFDAARDIGLIELIGGEIDALYLDKIAACAVEKADCHKDYKIIYTPLFGSGYKLLPKLFEQRGMKLTVIDEQTKPNGNFPGANPPNPERREVFELAVSAAKKQGAQLILGTDPDADRLGALVSDGDDYRMLTGNQIGALLCNYILSTKAQAGTLPKKGFVVKSLVSTNLAGEICKKYGIEIYDVLTGFKFIGEKIDELETKGDSKFLFGFEESYGYLGGSYARDKDALYGAMVFADMAIHYFYKGKSVIDVLNELYDEHGYFSEKTIGLDLNPIDGMEQLEEKMEQLRKTSPVEIGGMAVEEITDYQQGIGGLPPSNVLVFLLAGGSKVVIRPSGTEPKVKLYVMCRAADKASADEIVPVLSQAVQVLVK